MSVARKTQRSWEATRKAEKGAWAREGLKGEEQEEGEEGRGGGAAVAAAAAPSLLLSVSVFIYLFG